MILFLLASYGLFFVVAQATITSALRFRLCQRYEFLASMLACAFCTGFWASIVVSGFVYGIGWLTPVYALAGASVCLFLDQVLTVMETYVSSRVR